MAVSRGWVSVTVPYLATDVLLSESGCYDTIIQFTRNPRVIIQCDQVHWASIFATFNNLETKLGFIVHLTTLASYACSARPAATAFAAGQWQGQWIRPRSE